MNTKWETDCALLETASGAEQLTKLLELACRDSQQPDFKFKAEHQRRHAARSRFSPSLSYGRHFCPPLASARAAAVMILIEPRDDQWVIPLTVRPNHLPDHPGQVCLPGGRVEKGETIRQAAQREFCEELGLNHFPAHTIGQLQSIYVYNSDFCLTPCVAISREPLEYQPCADEVETLVYLPLAQLLDEKNYVVRQHWRGAASWTATGIETPEVHIWGATAIVLGELTAILKFEVSN